MFRKILLTSVAIAALFPLGVSRIQLSTSSEACNGTRRPSANFSSLPRSAISPTADEAMAMPIHLMISSLACRDQSATSFTDEVVPFARALR